MMAYFEEYFWKNGTPHGKKILPAELTANKRAYKIVSDPYGKRFSIEVYERNHFLSTIYDSILLDFRKLNPAEQMRWEKTTLFDGADKTIEIIRNEDDRAIYVETCLYKEGRCRECQISSVHGILLSTHRLFSTEHGDLFNGVILYDNQNKPVMKKSYAIDPVFGHFTTLLEEHWDMEYDH